MSQNSSDEHGSVVVLGRFPDRSGYPPLEMEERGDDRFSLRKSFSLMAVSAVVLWGLIIWAGAFVWHIL